MTTSLTPFNEGFDEGTTNLTMSRRILIEAQSAYHLRHRSRPDFSLITTGDLFRSDSAGQYPTLPPPESIFDYSYFVPRYTEDLKLGLPDKRRALRKSSIEVCLMAAAKLGCHETMTEIYYSGWSHDKLPSDMLKLAGLKGSASSLRS